MTLLGWALWEKVDMSLSLGSLAILLIFLSVAHKDQLQGLPAVGKVKK